MFEFFLAGHLECFKHLGGLVRQHRYDNLKSVVLSREQQQIKYNPQFLEFARFFGFSIHACNPYSGNEKGQVECDANKYSVPTSCAGQAAELCVYPSHIEVRVSGDKVATHKRGFGRKLNIRNPLHEERQLAHTPAYRMQRIYRVITGMDTAFQQFISGQEDESVRVSSGWKILTGNLIPRSPGRRSWHWPGPSGTRILKTQCSLGPAVSARRIWVKLCA